MYERRRKPLMIALTGWFGLFAMAGCGDDESTEPDPTLPVVDCATRRRSRVRRRGRLRDLRPVPLVQLRRRDSTRSSRGHRLQHVRSGSGERGSGHPVRLRGDYAPPFLHSSPTTRRTTSTTGPCAERRNNEPSRRNADLFLFTPIRP